jgi:DNA-binding MarR family transcriptional regulator
VNLTPGSIGAAVDRLFDKSLVSLVESSDDRRVRVASLTDVLSERVEGMSLYSSSRQLPVVFCAILLASAERRMVYGRR